MFFDNDYDPAMRYEGLARAAFNNCDKFDDPWGYASQEKYNNFIEEPISINGKRILSTILIKLVIDNKNTEYENKFLALEDDIWNSTTQDQIIKIIDDAIEIQLLKEK